MQEQDKSIIVLMHSHHHTGTETSTLYNVDVSNDTMSHVCEAMNDDENASARDNWGNLSIYSQQNGKFKYKLH